MSAIWIDLDNSPHVPLFAPIIRHYRERGVEVVVTARDHSQTFELLKLNGVDDFTVVGRHYGKRRIDKLRGVLARAKQLVSFIRKQDKEISVAVSHGSRSMVLGARWLKIPAVTMYDYEYTETRIFNVFSDKVLVPDRIPDSVLNRIGLPIYKRAKYPGIKEELYLRGFTPKSDLRSEVVRQFGEDPSKFPLVVVRPPATTANYHSSKSDELFRALINLLVTTPNVYSVVVPRTREQGEIIRQMVIDINARASCLILVDAVDGLDLIHAADLVISGGGTMNREAVLLGVPVYSIFAGRQGALDEQMESEGLMTFIRDASDLGKIILERRQPSAMNTLTARVENFVIDEIDRYLT